MKKGGEGNSHCRRSRHEDARSPSGWKKAGDTRAASQAARGAGMGQAQRRGPGPPSRAAYVTRHAPLQEFGKPAVYPEVYKLHSGDSLWPVPQDDRGQSTLSPSLRDGWCNSGFHSSGFFLEVGAGSTTRVTGLPGPRHSWGFLITAGLSPCIKRRRVSHCCPPIPEAEAHLVASRASTKPYHPPPSVPR